MNKIIPKLIIFSLALTVCSCEAMYESNIDAYLPVLKMYGLEFRIREFVANELKDWDQVRMKLDKAGGFECVWIPKGGIGVFLDREV